MTEHSRIEPDFFPPTDEREYDAWFRAKVEASLADPRPSIPHQEVVAHMRKRLAGLRREK